MRLVITGKAVTDMHLIVYTSESTSSGAAQMQDLAEIVGASRRNNVRVEITGVMFHQNGRYLQLLEGPENAVRTLMSRITRDSRHCNLQVLFDQPITERGFPNWSMDVFEVEESTSVGLDVLTTIRDGYENNFRVSPAAIVAVFKGLIRDCSQDILKMLDCSPR